MKRFQRYRFTRVKPIDDGEIVVPGCVRRTQFGEILVGGSATVQQRAKSQACIWRDGEPRAQENLPGYKMGVGYELTASGVLVGTNRDYISNPLQVAATIWRNNNSGDSDESNQGEGEELSPLDGHDSAEARCMNVRGFVGGNSFHSRVPLERRAVVWFDGTPRELPVPDSDYPVSAVLSMNDAFIAVGKVSNSDKSSAIAIWLPTKAYVISPERSPVAGAWRITNKNAVLLQVTRNGRASIGVWTLPLTDNKLIEGQFNPTYLRIPVEGVSYQPVLDDTDGVRVVINGRHTEGLAAGVPAPFLYEAETVAELSESEPIDLNARLQLPRPWGLLECITDISDGGIMVGFARYAGVESAVLIVPEE